MACKYFIQTKEKALKARPLLLSKKHSLVLHYQNGSR